MTAFAIVVAVVLLALNALFVAVEFALIASRRQRLEELAEGSGRKARRARRSLQAISDLNRQLAGAQLGITMASLALGFLAEPAVAHLLELAIDSFGELPSGLKHTIATTPVRHDGKRVARRTDATVAPTKEDWAAKRTQQLSVLHADTLRAGELVKPRSVDAVVTDAPYGVQHGSRHPEHGLARGPLGLLEEAVPVWVGLLRPGGALGIAWNTHVAARDDLADLLERHGLLVADSEPYRSLRHRVDSSIMRDVIVARRPS